MSRMQVAVELTKTLHHFHGSVECTLDIVFAHRRHSENGHHGVADELLHRSAPRLDRSSHSCEIGVENGAQALGIEAVTQRRGADGVRKEDRD